MHGLSLPPRAAPAPSLHHCASLPSYFPARPRPARVNAEDWQPRLLEWKMIMIGKAGNGDAVVVRFEDEARCPVGFIRLDEFVSKNPQPEKAYFEIESSLERFFFRAAERLYLPCDSYACEEWDDFQRTLELRKS